MNFCEVDIEDYDVRNCGMDFAGVVGIGLIDVNESPSEESLQSTDFWLSVTENTSKYFVIRNTRGEYNGGEPIEEEDLIGIRVVGATHSAVIDSTGIAENWEYWNSVVKKLWKVCIVTSGGLLYYVDKPTSIYTKVSNAKSMKAQAFYQSELKWFDLSNPVILVAPGGIFYGVEPIFTGTIYTFDSDMEFYDSTIINFDNG